MTYFPRIRPVLGVALWCGFLLACFLVGMILATLAAVVFG